MSKRKIFIVLIAVAAVAVFATSCGSDFYEGFREGWNQTAPPEYRY